MILNKMYKQQSETKTFFDGFSNEWAKRSNFKKNKILNTIQERNLYVLGSIKKNKTKNFLDIGCGTGDLVFETSKFTKLSVGIDFSDQMIKLSKKKFKRDNLEFINTSLFKYETKKKFDCISANGFIEYLSLNDIKEFFKITKKLLNKNGYLIFGSRNRLFNIFSLNEFSKNEIKDKQFKMFYEEALALNLHTFKKFINLKKNKFNGISYKQPKTGIKVNLRHQFSPLQLIDILKGYDFKINDLSPINYHPVLPSIFNQDINFKKFSNYIYNYNKERKLPLIPFSSSFMISVTKK